jgi:hypothetical protein
MDCAARLIEKRNNFLGETCQMEIEQWRQKGDCPISN